jgi:hypothetical protein
MIAFSIIILIYSLWILYQSVAFYQRGQTESFLYGVVLGSFGMALALSFLTRIKRRINVLYAMSARIVTVTSCEKCGFKVVRAFSKGDYVHKPIGKCQQCGENMFISSIYAEEPERKGFL